MATNRPSFYTQKGHYRDLPECSLFGEKLQSMADLVRHMKEKHGEEVKLRKLPHPKKPE